MKKKQIVRIVLVLATVLFILSVISVTSQAAGLIDDTIDASNNYSKYSVDNYQLDYFVDSSWDWLPWNWGDGIGKSVMYGIYAITNFIWIIGVYLSNATGYLVSEAYSLDFISDTTEAIGRNIQTLAGIDANGFMETGFFPGLLLLLILVMGVYVTYMGLIKRETTKAVGALLSFLTIFILSTSFIAYSTDYISKINEFSADISNAALNVGTKMTMPNTETGQKSSVDAIRDSLFEIQVKKPWMILQFGDSDLDSVGIERVEALESTSPFINKGKDRIEIIKEEINDKDNDNLTITKTINRLGVVVFIFFFNILISVFVFILTGIMIFSQLLFIIFAVFLPVSFLLSMIPSFNHLMKSAVIRLFNVIMMRAGITLVLTISFSLSAMVYSLTTTQPFFVVAFMQIVVFAGIYFKLNDLMGMMSLNSSDSQNIGGRVMRRPKQTVSRTLRKIAIGRLAMKTLGNKRKDNPKKKENERQKKTTNDKSSSKNRNTNKPTSNKTTDRNQSEKLKQDARKNKTKDQYTKEDSLKEKDKIDAARKFKQSKYKGRQSEKIPDDKGEISKNNSNLKRRKAPTRTLEKPRKNPKNERVKSLRSDDSFDKRNLPLENKDRKIKNKIRPKPPTSNKKKSRDFSKQPRELGGQALKRKTTLIQERKKETNKGTSTKKTNNLSGKGSTRK